MSAAATVAWLVVVSVAGWWSRVGDQWESAVTMLFGSFLAGSSPEGGGAVAFPVFTKALNVPGPVARSFGLLIQSVGMTMAVASIVLFRRTIHRRAVLVGIVAAVTGFAFSVLFIGQHDEPFWPLTLGTSWVKATFSIVLATTSVLMVTHQRHGDHTRAEPATWTRRSDVGLALAALAGGVLSAMAGTGANIMVFLFLVVLADVDPKTALASAIAVMAAVSGVGLVLFGVVDGQLNVELVGDRVAMVGGQTVDLLASEADLLGLWLAAVPVVVWGAPLGALAASIVPERVLVRFVAVLAAVEVITTIILVPDIRSDARLGVYLVAGVLGLPWLWLTLRKHRARVFATPDPR